MAQYVCARRTCEKKQISPGFPGSRPRSHFYHPQGTSDGSSNREEQKKSCFFQVQQVCTLDSLFVNGRTWKEFSLPGVSVHFVQGQPGRSSKVQPDLMPFRFRKRFLPLVINR